MHVNSHNNSLAIISEAKCHASVVYYRYMFLENSLSITYIKNTIYPPTFIPKAPHFLKFW